MRRFIEKVIGGVLMVVPIQFVGAHIAIVAGYEIGCIEWYCYTAGLGLSFYAGLVLHGR